MHGLYNSSEPTLFQMINARCYKIMHGEKTHLECKTYQRIVIWTFLKSKTFHIYMKRLLKYSSFFQLHICMLQQTEYNRKYNNLHFYEEILKRYIIHKIVSLFLLILCLENSHFSFKIVFMLTRNTFIIFKNKLIIYIFNFSVLITNMVYTDRYNPHKQNSKDT